MGVKLTPKNLCINHLLIASSTQTNHGNIYARICTPGDPVVKLKHSIGSGVRVKNITVNLAHYRVQVTQQFNF
jgi:hypothetical protein